MSDDKTMIKGVADLLAEVRKENAYLIVISGKSVGKMFKLAAVESVIGRSDDAEIRLEDDGVSRKHAKIVKSPDGTVKLIDLNSTNGTYFNGSKVDIQGLKDGDKIQIGSATILKFSYQDSLEEQFQKQLYDSATRDGLTKIYNKRFFLDRLKEEFSYCIRHRLPLSLVLFDIDHFKKINDTYGHQAGDYVLSTLAAKVQDTIRTEDIFCRYGGEEFAIIMRESEEDKAFIFAERVRRLIQATEFVFQGTKIPVTISMGVATLRDANFPGPDDLIVGADKYLYRAKQTGRNRVEAKMLSG